MDELWPRGQSHIPITLNLNSWLKIIQFKGIWEKSGRVAIMLSLPCKSA